MAKAERWERVRATSEEIERWKAMARASGMPLSELVRQSIGRARAWSPDRAAIERDRTLQLARIGSNLNQVARWANARKSAADAVRVTAALVARPRKTKTGRTHYLRFSMETADSGGFQGLKRAFSPPAAAAARAVGREGDEGSASRGF